MADEFVKSFENISLCEEIGGDFPLDEGVIAVLPKGTKVTSCDSHGSSAWTRTARITAVLDDGSQKRYFLKCLDDHAGRVLVEGEYNSMVELSKVMPKFFPKPHCWGKFADSSMDTYFFLCDFVEMSSKLPNPRQFCTQLAELHKKSVSPTGQFGFHVTTCHGRFPQVTPWESSWPKAYYNFLKGCMDIAREENESWPEFDAVCERVLEECIPAVLGPLEANGRSIKPSLIHSDCWEGNIGTSYETGQIVLFDSGCFYAHHELEIAMWRVKRSRMGGKTYLKEYLRHSAVSEPVEMFDDRNRIYSLVFNFWHICHYPGSSPRNEAFDDMCFLVEKFGQTKKAIESPVIEEKVEGSLAVSEVAA